MTSSRPPWLHSKIKIIFAGIIRIPKYLFQTVKVNRYTLLIFKTSEMASLTFIRFLMSQLVIVNESLLALILQTFNVNECLEYKKNFTQQYSVQSRNTTLDMSRLIYFLIRGNIGIILVINTFIQLSRPGGQESFWKCITKGSLDPLKCLRIAVKTRVL